MNLSDIHLLQAAIMLAEVRNYSRAARKLGIQQPTLTKRILELEHFIGFPLFLRSTQAGVFNLTQDIRGEARIVERAFGIEASALAEAVALIGENFNLQPT